MDHITTFPRPVREIENTWIPMPDGTRLAARIWLPADAEDDPVPAILEYLPYRKRDGTVERDHLTHPYFAGHGYAGVRVDMRGTGDSEGICLGEYLAQEQDDAVAVINWLAQQPWCSGAVGMIGISWGGFNGLQVAARRPAPLRAIISICSTDDRYADDIHFMGGCVLTDKARWGATAFSIAHTPPDPAIVGDRWRDLWRQRLQNNGCWLFDWFRHQRRDAFYAHGSVCEDYADIDIPVYMVGGWADGYTNAVLRTLDHLPGPKKGLIGPWAHKYPHFAKPGPQIGFLQEALRWWDHHLKGIDTGIMAEPMLRAWMQEPDRPRTYRDTWPGTWVAEPAWHGTAITTQSLHPGPQGLSTAGQGAPITLASPQTAGWTAGAWFGYGLVPDAAADQMGEAGLMTSYETAPLSEDLTLLGFPMLHARVTSDAPQANLAAVLSAVDEQGRATLISYGVLNLTHRHSHARPDPMPPGDPQDITMQLNACGQRIAAGQRLRLSLATSYWPIIWPSQTAATVTLEDTTLDLPLRSPRPEDETLAPFAPAQGAAPLQTEQLTESTRTRTHTTNLITGVETHLTEADSGEERHLHTGLVVRNAFSERFDIHPDDPNSARATIHWLKSYARDDWHAQVETTVTVAALREVWQITATLTATDQDGAVHSQNWSEDIPRDLV
ncbi:MAG: CocE/NonD family hydrolase [Pseudomonadota bacterium]